MKTLLFIFTTVLTVNGQISNLLLLSINIPDSTIQKDSKVEIGDSPIFDDPTSLCIPSLSENFSQFYMEIATPNPWMDYKIMLSKPDPGIDHKMLIKDVRDTVIVDILQEKR